MLRFIKGRPCRGSPHYEIEIFMCFNYSKLFNTNENKKFLFEIEDKEEIYVGENLLNFKQMIK